MVFIMFVLLSYKIDLNAPVYGGKKGFLSTKCSSIENGDTSNTSRWEFPNHIGTHLDFPHHFYQNGQTVDDFPEDSWILNGKKIELLEVNVPKKKFLIEINNIKNHDFNFGAEFLIFKTDASKYRNTEKFWKYNLGLSAELIDWIIKNFKNIKIIGLDSISISSWQHRDVGRMVHKKLLDPKNPILIVEDMDLSKVNKNTIFKMVYVAPIMVSRSDGGPCTILAEVK